MRARECATTALVRRLHDERCVGRDYQVAFSVTGSRVKALLLALDSGDWVTLFALGLIGGGIANWSLAAAAIVVGMILLALAWSPEAQKGQRR